MVVLGSREVNSVSGGVFAHHDGYIFPLTGMISFAAVGSYLELEGYNTAMLSSLGCVLGVAALFFIG